jgi:hypothetical protein
VALAPANFGFFSRHLLIGNAGSGQNAVYDVDCSRFDGLLRDANEHTIQNDRLWALRFVTTMARPEQSAVVGSPKFCPAVKSTVLHRFHNPPI